MKAITRVAGLGVASMLALPANAQLLAHKDLSLATALTIATTAMDTCKGQGYRVSVTVVGRNGEPLVQLRGEDASPHTYDFSFRKARVHGHSYGPGHLDSEKSDAPIGPIGQPDGYAVPGLNAQATQSTGGARSAVPKTAISEPLASHLNHRFVAGPFFDCPPQHLQQRPRAVLITGNAVGSTRDS